MVWDLKSSNQGVILSITVTPYVSKKYNKVLSFILMKIYIIPLLNNYLENVTKGIKLYVEKGSSIKKINLVNINGFHRFKLFTVHL